MSNHIKVGLIALLLSIFLGTASAGAGNWRNEISQSAATLRTGNYANALKIADQVLSAMVERLGAGGADDATLATALTHKALANAGLGNAAAAVSEGQKGMELQPSTEDPFEGPNREEQMAQIYALLGDADHAIPILQRLVHTSAYTEIVPTLLRLDPIWDPIRNDPRFQELVAEKKP